MKSQQLLGLESSIVSCKSFLTFALCLPFFLCSAQNNLPIGYLDFADQSGGHGWAYDQDAGTLPIKVHVYINGRFFQEIIANDSRPDLVTAGITPNPEHGYTFTITGFNTACAHEIVVYAINVGGGANPPLTNCPAVIGTQPSGASSISNIAGPSNIVIETTERLAGAIDRLTWNGKNFINSYDHGRQLQSATSFDSHGECYNPTEAGCEQDGTGNYSTSFLQCLNANGNYLETQTLPAFWIQPGGWATGCGTAINTTKRASHYFRKKVTIGMPGMAHVIKYDTEFDIPESYNSGTFEVVTGYMPLEFSVFWNYDPASQQLTSLSNSPGEQQLPIIFSTTDNNYAMGIYSPDLPDPQWSGTGYGRFYFPVGQGNCTKWNCVFRKNAVPIGIYKFRSFVIVGSSTNVQVSMTQLYNYFIITANFSANAVCVGLPTTFTDLTTGTNTETTYQWDINNDGSVESTTSGNYSYTFPTAGTYQVKLTTINGVAAAHRSSVIINVVVHPQPATPVIAASGATTFCQGGNVILDAGTGYTNYLWSNGIITQTNTITSSGNYSVTVDNGNGCSATSSATTVTVNAQPSTPTITANGTTTFCQGGNVILDAGAGYSTYSWSNGIATQTNTITSSGNYSVTVNNGGVCSATSSATTVTVNTQPSTPTITASGTTTFCQGNSVLLTATAAAAYLWSNGITTQTNTITSSGNYSVTVTNGSGCSATSSATVVTVHPSPNVTCTPVSVVFCVGDSVALTANGANSYYWTPATGLSASTGTTVTATPADTITYTIIGVASFGCTNTATATVTVNPLPTPTITASGTTTFCQGDSVLLTATAAAAYLWSNGISTQANTITSPGNYSVTVTNGSGCSATSSATAVIVNSQPSTPLITQNGTVLTSSAATGNQWYLNNTIIAGATSQNYTPSQSGNYSVTVVDSNGCTATSVVYNYTSTVISGSSETQSEIIVYPNPNDGKFQVQSLKFKVAGIVIYNLVGEKVYSMENGQFSILNSQFSIDLSAQPHGMYFVQVFMDGKVYNKKISLE